MRSLAVACVLCPGVACERRPPPVTPTAGRAAALVARAAKSARLSETELRTRLLRLESERRRCARTRQSTASCEHTLAALGSRLGLNATDLPALRAASTELRWELTLLRERTGLSEAEVRRIFSELMVAQHACEARGNNRAATATQCSDNAILAACTARGLNDDDCSLVASIGIDSGWAAPADTRRQLLFPN